MHPSTPQNPTSTSTATLPTLIDQSTLIVPKFQFECGVELRDVPVAYKTWGELNEKRDNAMVICHAFTGSADVVDWWGPLMGPGKAFDPRRFFIICCNVIGSPYGTVSPVTINPDTGKPYGPDFPPSTIRDDVLLHKHVLDHLQISSVAVVVGGSMGGMAVLEWPLCTPPGYIRFIIPLATSARHSAWCISWGEAQRQSIYSDPGYEDGYYYEKGTGKQPSSGLSAARMAALLTYRSRDSFESRFGRKAQVGNGRAKAKGQNGSAALLTPPGSPKIVATDPDHARNAHNDGHRNASKGKSQLSLSSDTTSGNEEVQGESSPDTRPPIFSAQSYLRYQGDKFINRFDANCYIHITRKMDTHDVSRDRRLISQVDGVEKEESEPQAVARVLSTLPPRALVIGIATDGLFTPSEQKEIAAWIPDAEIEIIESPDGHDGFLLEFEQINRHILRVLRREFGDYYQAGDDGKEEVEGFEIKKTSLFGEAEADIAHW
ncbi:L-homoserine-O-acetyltransferase [Marasmius crinis-equi]|uniref:L-homoserine-O-acetyltransferase n=1 Tax=Marasmius crinis-equi TaxID=585013 RepID=A0ABR3F9W0_9AGAR